MNKSQKLAVQRLRAKKRVGEIMQRHNEAWNGQEPEIIDGKQNKPPVEEIEDGENKTTQND